MSVVEVYDPAMCCSTGVCGPSVDPALVQFAADMDWLGEAGVSVQRFELSSQPGKFAEDTTVGALLAKQGEQALPAVVVDGALQCSGRYPTRVELAAWTGVNTEGSSMPLVEQSGADGGCGCAPGEC